MRRPGGNRRRRRAPAPRRSSRPAPGPWPTPSNPGEAPSQAGTRSGISPAKTARTRSRDVMPGFHHNSRRPDRRRCPWHQTGMGARPTRDSAFGYPHRRTGRPARWAGESAWRCRGPASTRDCISPFPGRRWSRVGPDQPGEFLLERFSRALSSFMRLFIFHTENLHADPARKKTTAMPRIPAPTRLCVSSVVLSLMYMTKSHR